MYTVIGIYQGIWITFWRDVFPILCMQSAYILQASMQLWVKKVIPGGIYIAGQVKKVIWTRDSNAQCICTLYEG